MPPQATSAPLAVSPPGPHTEAMCDGWCLQQPLCPTQATPKALSAPTPCDPAQGHPEAMCLFIADLPCSVALGKQGPTPEPPALPPASGHHGLLPASVLKGQSRLRQSEESSRSPECQAGEGKLLTVHHWCPPGLQDEMELGYIQAPHKTSRSLTPQEWRAAELPYKRILVSAWGHSWACRPGALPRGPDWEPCFSGME